MDQVRIVLLVISALVLPICAAYLVIKTDKRFVLHRIVIALFFLRGIGSLFKMLHLAGADQLLLVSDIGVAMGAFLLIWTGLRNPTRKLLLYQLICGVIAAIMVLNNHWPIYPLANVVRFLPYPLAALAGTIILNKLYVHPGERNMLIMYFIVAIIAVVLDLFMLF
jgi:hypothetical protein